MQKMKGIFYVLSFFYSSILLKSLFIFYFSTYNENVMKYMKSYPPVWITLCIIAFHVHITLLKQESCFTYFLLVTLLKEGRTMAIFSSILSFFQKKDLNKLDPSSTSSLIWPATFYAQLVIYDIMCNPPRVVTIEAKNFIDFIQQLTNETYTYASEKGGQIPFVAIREVVENIIHANLNNIVISILADGSTIRVADHGPGLHDKEKAFTPGFSTASLEMKHYIKGVGSGLAIAHEALRQSGGNIFIEDNLEKGIVVTLQIPTITSQIETPKNIKIISKPLPSFTSSHVWSQNHRKPQTTFKTKKLIDNLSSRQKKILLLVAEFNETGPSNIAKELNLSLSTAYRELVCLEELKLVTSLHSGKRTLTEEGLTFIGSIFE